MSYTDDPLVLRTDFSNEEVWKRVAATIEQPFGDRRAYVSFVDDQVYDGVDGDALLVLLSDRSDRSFAFVADRVTITHPEHPVLVIDLVDEPGRMFRVIPVEAHSVENNLSIANMRFEEFIDAAGSDGVFRGFFPYEPRTDRRIVNGRAMHLFDMTSAAHPLHKALDELIAAHEADSGRALEEYLRALLAGARHHADAEELSVEGFLTLLSDAFVAKPAPYDPVWAENYTRMDDAAEGFAHCERVLLRQIVDLHEMREAGTLDGPWIGLGVDAPRGERWYNFGPDIYLGGAAMAIDTREPEHGLEGSPHAITTVTWQMFARFLEFGQMYE